MYFSIPTEHFNFGRKYKGFSKFIREAVKIKKRQNLGIFPNGGGGVKTKSAFFPTCGWEKRGGINFGDQIPNLLLFKKFYLTKKYINKILKHCYSY